MFTFQSNHNIAMGAAQPCSHFAISTNTAFQVHRPLPVILPSPIPSYAQKQMVSEKLNPSLTLEDLKLSPRTSTASTLSDHDHSEDLLVAAAQAFEEKRIGLYSMSERKRKILRYKARINKRR